VRRGLIGLLAVMALLAAACNGDEADVVDDVAAECEVGETDGDLALFNWSDYMEPELITKFQDEFGVGVTQDEFPSNEEMLARIQAGGHGYDVIVPSDYMVEIMIEQDLLLSLNHDAIPNFANVGQTFRESPFDPGNAFSAPYQWGTTGIGVNVDEVDDVPHSWGLIFEPEMAQRYSGQITMLDDARETMGAALKYLGHSLNTTDEAELQEAADLIRQARDHVATFTSLGYEDLLATGETLVAHGWSGDILTAVDESEVGELEYVIPEEGSVIWVDNMAIPADAPNPCTAHTFLNFMLDAENGAALTNYVWYASPNEAAEEFIESEILEDPSIYPPEDVLGTLEYIEDVGETTPIYEQLFTEVKS
jgi:spermidine/putrescine-binding protein